MIPWLKVEASDPDFGLGLNARVLKAEVVDDVGFNNDTVTLTLDDSDGAVVLPPPESTIKVSLLGFKGGALVEMGTYTIGEIKLNGPPNVVVVTATAVSTSGPAKEKKTREWHDVTVGDIVTTIATEIGLEGLVPEDLAATAVAHKDQVNETGMSFLRKLAREHGAVVKATSSILYFGPSGQAKDMLGQAIPVTVVPAGELQSWDALVQTKASYTFAVARYRDASSGQIKTIQVGGGVEGGAVLTLDPVFADIGTARTAAISRLRDLGGEEDTITFTTDGNPELTSEGKARLPPLRERGHTTEWLLQKVTHTLDTNGYSTKCDGKVPSQ